MAVKRRNPDQYLLRLPEGLRDRIQAYADRHGRSMNAEIVRILEREFPPSASIEQKVTELLEMIALLRTGRSKEFFGRFSDELFSTLVEVVNGRVKVDEETRKQVEAALFEWNNRYQENAHEAYISNMDDGELAAYEQGRDPVKISDPFEDDK